MLLPDREWYDPDVATAVSSGVVGVEPGDVVVLAPDHGAYYSGLSPDGRECRMVGVVKPWWESVVAKLTPEGIAPAPGWMLVERQVLEEGVSPLTPCRRAVPQERHPPLGSVIASLRLTYSQVARVLASCGDEWSSPHLGERVCVQGLRTYTLRFDGFEDAQQERGERMALVRAPIASKKWLSSLARTK